jgi:hypothetical protein
MVDMDMHRLGLERLTRRSDLLEGRDRDGRIVRLRDTEPVTATLGIGPGA